MRETLKEPQEEEGFQEHHCRHDDDDDLLGCVVIWIWIIGYLPDVNGVLKGYQLPCCIELWLILVQRLYRDITITYPDVALIEIVPDVAEVLGEPLLLQLGEVVDRWIDQRDSHECKEDLSMLKCSIDVDFIDENTEDHQVHDME